MGTYHILASCVLQHGSASLGVVQTFYVTFIYAIVLWLLESTVSSVCIWVAAFTCSGVQVDQQWVKVQWYHSSNKSWSKALGISLVLQCIQQLPHLCDLGECDWCLRLLLCLGLGDLGLDCLPLGTWRLLWEPEEVKCFHWLDEEEERHSMGCSGEWLGLHSLLSSLEKLSRLYLAVKEAGIIWSQWHARTHLHWNFKLLYISQSLHHNSCIIIKTIL